MISCPKVVVLPITDQVVQKVNERAYAEGVTTLKIYDKNGDLEFIQDADQIEGVDIVEQGYAEEAFDQDYAPHDEPDDDNDANLGRFYAINEDENEDLINNNIPYLYGNDAAGARAWVHNGFEYYPPSDEDDEDEVNGDNENEVNGDNTGDDLDSQQDEQKDTP
ncbi:MAG: hypothetical protein SGBAC_012620, partial [Bacillariaceae sp.]